MANVAIGVIADDKVDSDFVRCLLQLLGQRGGDIKGRVVYTQGAAGRLDVARHVVTASFMNQTDADYLLWLDADMQFTIQDYDHLVEAAREAEKKEQPCLISGLYARTDGSFCVFDLEDSRYHAVDPHNLAGRRWYEPDGVGLGFCIVPRTLFLDLGGPTDDNRLPWYENAGVEADDTSLCRRAKEAGYQIFVDLNIKLGHLKTVAMYPQIPEGIQKPELIVP